MKQQHTTRKDKAPGDSVATNDQDDQLAMFYAELSEDNSNTLKKETCYEGVTTTPNSTSIKHTTSTNGDTAHHIADNNFLLDILEQSDITGVKCQAPFTTEWLGEQYHNAMISNVYSGDDDSNIYNTQVDVLFLNPVMDKMKPCPYFLDEKCR